jgi:hypothetical protein
VARPGPLRTDDSVAAAEDAAPVAVAVALALALALAVIAATHSTTTLTPAACGSFGRDKRSRADGGRVRFARMWMSLAESIDEARGSYEFPRGR